MGVYHTVCVKYCARCLTHLVLTITATHFLDEDTEVGSEGVTVDKSPNLSQLSSLII